MDDNYSICFIIALKYIKTYKTYIDIYINNINKFYKNSYILIVDNNSENLNDIIVLCKNYNNVNIITNTSESKYEVGAYIFGLNYLIKLNILNKYDLFIFTQDTFILTNKFDFNILINNNINACPIVEYSYDWDINGKRYCENEMDKFLSPIGLADGYEHITLCWGNNFVCRKNKIILLFNYIRNIIIKTKNDSATAERFMARIIYQINSKRNFNIDGELGDYEKKNDTNSFDFDYNNNKVYFQKKHQYKGILD